MEFERKTEFSQHFEFLTTAKRGRTAIFLLFPSFSSFPIIIFYCLSAYLTSLLTVPIYLFRFPYSLMFSSSFVRVFVLICFFSLSLFRLILIFSLFFLLFFSLLSFCLCFLITSLHNFLYSLLLFFFFPSRLLSKLLHCIIMRRD